MLSEMDEVATECRIIAGSLKGKQKAIVANHDLLKEKRIKKSICSVLNTHKLKSPDLCHSVICKSLLNNEQFCDENRPKPPAVSQDGNDTVNLQKAFVSRFVDPNKLNVFTAEHFFKYCSYMGNGPVYYSKSCAIVQSSGTGKSRIIAEISKNRPVYYGCCREKGENAFPYGTEGLMEFFSEKIAPPRLDPAGGESTAAVLKEAGPVESYYYDVMVYSRCVSVMLASFTFSLAHWDIFKGRYSFSYCQCLIIVVMRRIDSLIAGMLWMMQ